MKIAFLVTSINSRSGGLGGHYRSLLETAYQIAKHNEVLIINIGNNEAKALQCTNKIIYKVIYPGISFIKTYKKLKQILVNEKVDFLHAFDSLAYYWARLLGRRLKLLYCLTKCGGVNPKYYFPYSKNLVLYSYENFVYFKTHPKFRDSSLYLIPNRIKVFMDDHERIREINTIIDKRKSSFKFLRIARIGGYYKNSTYQLINLVTRLRSDGIDCCAIFVGAVEDEKLFEELKNLNLNYLYFITTQRFTENAKALINCSDAVLGTGRSFMEGTVKGKIMLCPVSETAYPALIKTENFQTAFNYNFSERLHINNYSESNNYKNIKEVIRREDIQLKLQKFSKDVFEKYFDSNNITIKYNEVYNGIQSKRRIHAVDFFLHTLFIVRSYFT